MEVTRPRHRGLLSAKADVPGRQAAGRQNTFDVRR